MGRYESDAEPADRPRIYTHQLILLPNSAASELVGDRRVLRPPAVGDPGDLLHLADRRPLVAAEPSQRVQVLDSGPAVAHRGLPGADQHDPAEDDGAVAQREGGVQPALDGHR